MLSRLGGCDERAEDVALIVSELVTNAVVHAPDGDLELRLHGSPTLLRIEVSDSGTAPFAWPPDTTDGHWGLNLVTIFSDRVGVVRDPSTCVWCELDLDGARSR
jgi:anti-sigma regulatory factor (Ser/Thr protein kinase)